MNWTKFLQQISIPVHVIILITGIILLYWAIFIEPNKADLENRSKELLNTTGIILMTVSSLCLSFLLGKRLSN